MSAKRPVKRMRRLRMVRGTSETVSLTDRLARERFEQDRQRLLGCPAWLDEGKRERWERARQRLLSCPAWLDEGARQRWRRLAPELERTGWLKRSTKRLLAVQCAASSLAQRAEQILTTRYHNELTVEIDGIPEARFEVLAASAAWGIARELSGYLGTDPAARTRRANKRER